MNDKDKEEFDKWFIEKYRYNYNDLVIPESVKPQKEAWQSACEYKQKEIDSIDCYIERDEKIKKLQAENSKLVSKINLAMFIMKDNEWHNDESSIEYQVYKILEKAIEEL